MTDFSDLQERIDAMCTRASGAEADPALITDMEDLLSEGYLRALTAEATSRRLERRLDELLGTVGEDDAAREACRLAVERRTIQGRVDELRLQLLAVRQMFVGLGGGRIGAR